MQRQKKYFAAVNDGILIAYYGESPRILECGTNGEIRRIVRYSSDDELASDMEKHVAQSQAEGLMTCE